jgi:hypothetical protein
MGPMSTTHDREAYWQERVLSLSYRQVAAAMRSHDVAGPLTTDQARWYREGLEPMPEWLSGLYDN